MKSQHSYHNAIIIDKNTDSKIDSIVPYNYKKRREELNQVVKHHIERQKQQVVQKSKALSV
ncbi:hypothetical protein [Candidatus Rickettsia colombianensi]|uniref:hypothetical protein n=1 Tax=Candidatus Rickettsia colombianensi TaxID=1090944 RepID=UPI000EF1E9BF|nr:hypothetical protein [Candidatus Rickettsia colombianensi]